ncbi:MAG: FliM/FliN family flagellar motor switch protein [Thermogutta sp.]
MAHPKLVAILECLKTACEEVEASFQRTFDQNFRLGNIDRRESLQEQKEVLRKATFTRGLSVEFHFEGFRVEIFLPDEAEVIPKWAENPDPTGKAKLATLAQELGILLFPPDWPLRESAARVVPAFTATELPEDSPGMLLPVNMGNRELPMLIRLLGEEATAYAPVTPQAPPRDQPASTEKLAASTAGVATPPPARTRGAGAHPVRARILPLLTRSLLKIKLPVEVILARTRKPLAEILQLAPGTIIQFNKSCDEPLELAVNGYVIARGEAVKVGDKFGLRILEMTLPPERYVVLSGRTSSRTDDARKVSTTK